MPSLRRASLPAALPVVAALLGILTPAGRDASPQDPKPAFQRPAPDAAVLQRAFELAQKAPEHELLQRLVGTWDVALRIGATGGESTREQSGTVAGQAMLGGRYVVLNFRLALGDAALEAVQIVGFDTLRREFTASWRDDRSTWSVECRGEPDAQAPMVLDLRGTLVDARDPEGRPFRLELDLCEAGRVVARLYDRRGDDESLLQEQRWTRRG